MSGCIDEFDEKQAPPRDYDRDPVLPKVVATTEMGLEIELADTLAKRGIYDVSRLRERKPEIYRATLKLLGRGIATELISELMGLDYRTVEAVRADAQSAGAITGYKQETLKSLRAIITLGLQGLLEKARDGKISPIEMCALIDKAELLSGGATVRVEHTEDPAVVEFKKRFLAAHMPPEMVLGDGNVSQSAIGNGEGRVIDLVPVRAVEAPERVSRDMQSSEENVQSVQYQP